MIRHSLLGKSDCIVHSQLLCHSSVCKWLHWLMQQYAAPKIAVVAAGHRLELLAALSKTAGPGLCASMHAKQIELMHPNN